ncbi:MAG TPA: hypothetical protein VFF44_02245 [Casimicrobiaceae bacterium]|nr:hypothetical protein [Casimicrobiaceae bacterium]
MWFALMLWLPLAMAQSNLGELLDAGAKRLSPDEFKEQVVQRVIVGPSATGGSLQVIYQPNGLMQGTGTAKGTILQPATIFGEWTIDDNGRICASMQSSGGGGGGYGTQGVTLPRRCQTWFKLDSDYFISDSDSDRYARVLRRTMKQ